MLASACATVLAGPIYRCGPDGREYSQTPCSGGTVVESSDTRSAAQRAEARRVAERERQLASDLERQRRADEAALKPSMAVAVGPQATAPAARGSTKSRKKTDKAAANDDFVAVGPGTKAAAKPR